MTTEIQQENTVSECLPKKFDIKIWNKVYYESNKEKIREARRAYYESNKEKIKTYREVNKEKLKTYRDVNKEKLKTYRDVNKDKIAERKKVYYESNKEKIKERKKVYYESNKEKIREARRAYYESNKEKVSERHKLYMRERLKEDPLFAAKEKLRNCVKTAFRRIKQNKPTDTQTLLGCSWQEAREHFERMFKEGMTWENHGEWHIDHIRPVSSFAEDELHLMNHISNLQPLWEDENLSKRAKIPPTPEVARTKYHPPKL